MGTKGLRCEFLCELRLAYRLAVAAAFIGIISTFASNQTEKSNADLKRAVAIIERLEKQVATVIGDEWTPLDTDQVEKLRDALSKLPFTGTAQVMYSNAYGKSFAQSLATAFRTARWDVRFGTGGGLEAGIVVGPGPSGEGTYGRAVQSD